MKYNIGEFYPLPTGLISLKLTVDERANSFSEAFFKEVYAKNKEGIVEIDVEKDDIFLMYENDFYSDYEVLLKMILPSKVRDRIADKRVLALGYVSPKNYRIIAKYLKKHKKSIEKPFKRYYRQFLFTGIFLPKQLRHAYYYRSEILSFSQCGNDLILDVNICSVFGENNGGRGKLILRDFKISEQKSSDLPVMFDNLKIYKTLHGFECYFQLSDRDTAHCFYHSYITVVCKRIELA